MTMATYATVVLKAGREKSLRRLHPWVFSGAIEKVDRDVLAGQTVALRSQKGEFLAWAVWSPRSQIRARVWGWEQSVAPDAEAVSRMVGSAVSARGELAHDPVGACRVVFGESDGLPGVIADRYGDFVVCQFLSAGAERFRADIVEALMRELKCRGAWERSDSDVRAKEGLTPRTGPLAGDEPPQWIEIVEDGSRYRVDVRNGHKTGFYLDQRVNRGRVAQYCDGARVLNCFGYTGGFSIAALREGAQHVTNLDSSAPALALARDHAQLNGFAQDRCENVTGDAFAVLRDWRRQKRQFDVVVLDPPKFVESRERLMSGARGYKDINMCAFALVRPGGHLVTFSCSGLVGEELFQKIVADAACDAGRRAMIVERLCQAPDHPVGLAFPEAWYLKGMVVRVE